MKKVLIVGGGAAGLMAAIAAAEQKADVTLLEKKKRVGEKLRITGKGRCNITSALEGEQLMAGYPGNASFLYSALHEFSNLELRRFLSALGLETIVERGGRVFPATEQAADVVRVLEGYARKTGVKIITGLRVLGIIVYGDQIRGVETDRGAMTADAVIIATGGLSYPGTGSTGDGYKWAQDTGHRLVDPRPGLVPLVTAEDWVPGLRGLSLKNVSVSAYQETGKKMAAYFGEMLFTDFGISGPIILSLSRDIGDYMHQTGRPVQVQIDLKPALTPEQLEKRIQRDLDLYSRRALRNALYDLLPRSLVPVIIALSGLDPDKRSNTINREERRELGRNIKKMPLTVVGTRPIAEAIVTAGGVDVRDVNPRTMASKRVQGLFFAGEVLDVDGYTGGFNLQAAFSTGYVAGKHAAVKGVRGAG